MRLHLHADVQIFFEQDYSSILYNDKRLDVTAAF